MKSDIEQSYIADIISSRYPTSDLPEGIVEIGDLTRSPEQFSANATKREGGVGFVAGAAPAPMSSSSTAQVSQPRFGRAGVTAEQSAAAGGLEKPITALADMLAGIPRGMTAQTMGLGGDLESLYNGLTSIFNRPEDQPRIDAFLQGLAQKTNMATTEQISKEGYRIPFTDINMPPLPPVVPVGSPDQKSREASANYGQFFGELAPIPSIIDVGVTGLKAGAKALAPNAANMMEQGLRKSGMIMDIVPDGKSVIKPEDIKLIEETKSDWIFELPNGTRKNVDKFEYLSDIATMGQYAPSKEQMILSAKKDVAQMVYEQANKQAPKSDIGFYSAVENATINIQRKSGTGQSFLNDIMKGENVKPEEIKWMGLDDFLKNKKNVTKQEVQDYISNNKVDVREVKSTVIRPLLDNGARPVMEGDKGVFLPKFGTYQLAGGENYRELLLTMPSKNTGELDAAQKQADSLRKQTADLMADWKRISEEKPASNESKAAYVKVTDSRRLLNEAEKTVSVIKKESGLQTYSSEHFNQPNILAHLRVNDRVDADGKKMLLIEEVQSDWHQAGRDIGYAKNVQNEINAIQKQMDELGNQRDPVTNRMTNEKQWFELGKQKDELIKQSQGVPDAPFKDTWYQLALKRALQYASENGYERVGLTTGKQQIDRYSNAIRQNVDQISFYPFGTKGGTEVYAKKDNKVTFRGIIIDGKFIDGQAEGLTADKVLGKSMAKQITEKKDGVITGDNLSIGGEGMKKYYDEAYPNFIDKYAKKWNAKIGETKINPKGTAWKYGLDVKDTDIPVRYVDITPEMKAGVQKGQPLFAAAPIGAATGAATMQDERKK
jgi:hypothetical protein